MSFGSRAGRAPVELPGSWALGFAALAPALGVLLLVLAATMAAQALRPPALEPAPDLVDFFPLERNEQFAYQFAGHEATLFWNRPLPPGSVLTLRVRSPEPLPARDLILSHLGQTFASAPVGDAPVTLRVLLPPGDPALAGYALDLSAEAARASGDSRELGHLYEAVALRAPAEGPPWALMAGAAALTLAAGAALALAGAGWVAGGVAAVALSLVAPVSAGRFWAYGAALVIAAVAARLLLPGPTARLGARVRGISLSPPALASLAVAAAFGAWLGWLSVAHHEVYGTNAFDLGLYDQSLWQISRGQALYSTAAGINMVGSHANLMLFPLAALYWVLPDARTLLVAHAVGTALAAVPLYLIARDRGMPWLGPVVAAAYLAHPAVQNAVLYEFHIDPMAATALLCAIWAADGRRWRWLALFAAVVTLSKENFAVTVAWLGALLVLRRDVRPGLLLMAGATAWFLFATGVLVPALIAQDQSIHMNRFARYGDSVPEILLTVATRPWLLLGDLFPPGAGGYLFGLLAPLAFLPLLSPVALLAMPGLAINLLAQYEYQRTLLYQYNALVTASLAAAALYSALWLTALAKAPRARLAVGAGLSAALLAAAVLGQGVSDLRREQIGRVMWRNEALARHTAYALSFVPPGANVSVQMHMQPHVTHRQQAFLYPNPFRAATYHNPAAQPFAADVEYIAYDRRRPSSHDVPAAEQLRLLDELEASGQFRTVVELNGVVLLEREGP